MVKYALLYSLLVRLMLLMSYKIIFFILLRKIISSEISKNRLERIVNLMQCVLSFSEEEVSAF